MAEHLFLEDEIAKLLSWHLIGQANRYLIPTPEFKQEGAWVQSNITGLWHLTPHAMLSLRTEVRQERKERSEYVQKWLTVIATFIAAMTGLVGALIGVLAMLSSK